MDTSTQTIKNVTITDARQLSPANKPEKAPETPKEQSADERAAWDKVRDRVNNRMFPEKKDKKPAEKKEEKSSEKVVEKKAEKDDKKELPDGGGEKQGATDDQKPKAKLKPVAKKEDAPPVDYEKLGTTIAAATAKAIREESNAKDTKKEDEDIPEARRRDLEAIKYLDENNPKYKGKLNDYRKFAKAESDYVARWEKNNPGQVFDPESDDHSEFYDKNEPGIDLNDITDARVELAAERRAKSLIEKETGSTKQELERMRVERDVERADQVAPAFINRNVSMVVNALGEDVVKAFKELKPDQSLEESDPAAHMALQETLTELAPKTRAAVRIFGTNGRAYNEKDPIHVEIAKEAVALDKLVMSQTEEARTQPDGRTYASLDQWAGMSDAEKALHWTIDADFMSAHLAVKASEKAKEKYESERGKLEKLAKAYGYVKSEGAKETKNGEKTEPEEEFDGNEKTRSPSTSTKTVIQPGKTVSAKTTSDGGEKMLGRMFRR